MSAAGRETPLVIAGLTRNLVAMTIDSGSEAGLTEILVCT